MKYELKDWLTSINQSKLNIMNEDPSSEKSYVPYIINRCLSAHIDSVFYASEMNLYPFLDKKLQYDFYINTLRSRKRYSSWLKKESIEDLDCIKSYYGYSNEKAKQALKILNKQQIDYIKSKINVGGKR